MKFKTNVLENGDLEISSLLEVNETRGSWINRFRSDYPKTYSNACEMFFENEEEFRFISDHEKVELGDLTDAEILTTLDIYDDLTKGEMYENLTPDQIGDLWNKNSWYYPSYMTTNPIEKLFTNGKTTFRMRGN